MEKITCPWDDHGKLLPGLTVRQYVQCLVDMGVSGNITIDRVFYNLHSLLIAPPDRVDLNAVIIGSDPGYYGTHGILTKAEH